MLSARYIIGLVAITLLAFGLPKQSITYSNEEWDMVLIRNIFYKPYFMLYGMDDESDACHDKVDHLETGRPFNITSDDGCYDGHWVPTVLQIIFLLVANLLLLNMLIAVFNDTFAETSKMAHEIWHYQRYYQVLGYNNACFLPPPFDLLREVLLLIFTILNVIYTFCEWICCKRCCHAKTKKKVSPEKEMKKKEEDELEIEILNGLHDFEDECMEELLREKDKVFCQSKKERMRVIDERTCRKNKKCSIFHELSKYIQKWPLFSYWTGPLRTDFVITEMQTLVYNDTRFTNKFDTRLQNNEEKLDRVVERLSKIGEQLETIMNSFKDIQTQTRIVAKDITKEEKEEIVNELNTFPADEDTLEQDSNEENDIRFNDDSVQTE